jgi:hypothetical protein
MVIRPYHEIFSNKNELLIHATIWMDCKNIVPSRGQKKSQSQKILYDSVYLTFSNDKIDQSLWERQPGSTRKMEIFMAGEGIVQ